MFGLDVRWALPPGDEVPSRLRRYVVETSLPRFSGMAGLVLKTWRMRPGEWFEGSYLFADEASRDAFAASFRATAETAPGSVIVGSPPFLVATFDVVAVAAGGEPLVPGAGPDLAD